VPNKFYAEYIKCTNRIMCTFNVEAFCGIDVEPNIVSPSCSISLASFLRHWRTNTTKNSTKWFILL